MVSNSESGDHLYLLTFLPRYRDCRRTWIFSYSPLYFDILTLSHGPCTCLCLFLILFSTDCSNNFLSSTFLTDIFFAKLFPPHLLFLYAFLCLSLTSTSLIHAIYLIKLSILHSSLHNWSPSCLSLSTAQSHSSYIAIKSVSARSYY